MIRCKDCSWFFRKNDYEVSAIYYDANYSSHGGPLMTINSDFTLRMCQHPKCFKIEEKMDAVHGIIKEKIRISGQGILNKGNDCTYHSPTLWRKFKLFLGIVS